jgi:hypothetical protein
MAKRASLLIAVALTSIAFWFLTVAWAANPVTALADFAGWTGVLLSLILMVAVYALALMLIPELSLRILAVFLVGIPALFIFSFHWLTIGAFVVMILLNLEAMRVIQGELKARLKVSIRGILSHPISMILTSIILLVSTVYYISPTVQQSREAKELPPTLTEMIQEVTRRVFSREFSDVPAKDRKQVENQVIKQVIGQLNTTAAPYLQYLPFVLTIGLFLLLVSLKFIFAWLAVSLSLGIFFILKKFGVVTIAEKPVTAEQIVL